MATKLMTFEGTCNWAKVFEENREMNEWDDTTRSFSKPSSCGGVYSIEMALSSTDYRELKTSGSLAAKFSKYDDDGNDVVRFKRQHEKKGAGGKVLDFASGAPTVFKKDGTTPWNVEKDGLIGNGSTVKVEVAVYDTSYSPGTRLESITVLNHVPVEGITSKEEEEIEW